MNSTPRLLSQPFLTPHPLIPSLTSLPLQFQMPPSAVRNMLTSIHALSAPGSTLAFDFLRLACLSGKHLTGGFEVMNLGVAARGEPFLSAIDDAPGRVKALAQLLGFRCAEHLDARRLAGRYLPHLAWQEWPAPVQPCFSFVEFAVDA